MNFGSITYISYFIFNNSMAVYTSNINDLGNLSVSLSAINSLSPRNSQTFSFNVIISDTTTTTVNTDSLGHIFPGVTPASTYPPRTKMSLPT